MQPELPDWLAGELLRGGWRLKPNHQLMLLSSAYRQDTTFADAGAQADPDNRLLGHRRPLRLDADFRHALFGVNEFISVN